MTKMTKMAKIFIKFFLISTSILAQSFASKQAPQRQ